MPKLDNDKFIEGQNAFARGVGLPRSLNKSQDLDDANLEIHVHFCSATSTACRVDPPHRQLALDAERAGRMTEKKPEPLIPESDPMCYLPQCLCKETQRAIPIQVATTIGKFMSRKSPKASSSRKKPRAFAQAFAECAT